MDINAACLSVVDRGLLILDPKSCNATFSFPSTLQYRVLPSIFQDTVQSIRSDQLATKDKQVYIAYDIPKNSGLTRYSNTSTLNYAGSFSRGFSLGNSQDLVLNSNLNLQLQGDLGDGLLIRGTITDDNLPIQAEGNTQVLQEFEQVYIEIEKKDTRLIAGDFSQNLTSPYFLNYAKKSKGVRLENRTSSKDSLSSISSYGSFAISRGKFNRQVLDVTEGNQGPYRLEGGGGQGFFVILSGTERVYRDGVLLTRGFDKDYTIDYNNATIQFTVNNLITSNARMVVEYEFADQQYLRSMSTIGTKFQGHTWTHSVDYYIEQDSRSATGIQQLDSLDRIILRDGGDDPFSLTRSSIQAADEIQEDILYYALRNGILHFPPDTNEVLYEANFSLVGQGNGSYIIDLDVNANGRVYKYVGPGLGDYEPVKTLVAPQSNQYITLRNEYQPDSSFQIISEVSINRNDGNRFSDIQDEDNTGVSWFGSVAKQFQFIRERDSSRMFLSTSAFSEIRHQHFQALNPYRNPEFNRDWSIVGTSDERREILSGAAIEVTIPKQLKAGYQLQQFARAGDYAGLKHVTSGNTSIKSTDFSWNTSFLTAQDSLDDIVFFRPTFSIKQHLGKRDSSWTLQLSNLTETNTFTDQQSDNLRAQSFHFEEYRAVLSYPETSRFDINFQYAFRNDFNAQEKLVHSLEGQEYGLDGFYNWNKRIKVNWYGAFRDLSVIAPELRSETPKRTYIGRLENTMNFWKNGLRINTFAQYNSGQTAKFEDQYIKVQKGQGQYRWVDSNMDSIQQVNEFLIADFADQGEYIKVAIFNNTFRDVKDAVFNQTVLINPQKILSDSIAFPGHKIIRKAFWTTRYKMNQKFEDDSNRFLWSFAPVRLDSALLVYQSSLDNTLHFNQGSPDYDIRIGRRSLRNRRTQIFGFEELLQDEWYQESRFSIKQFDMRFKSTLGTDERIFEVNPERNIDADFFSIEPLLRYSPKPSLRFDLGYTYKQKNNTADLSASISTSSGGEFLIQWQQSDQSSYQASFEYARVTFEGIDEPFVSLILLEGLKPGNNYLWQVQMSHRLTKVLELNINYNGRKTGESRMIHLGNATIRAIF